MRSARRGRSTSQVEITQISAHGIWLLAGDRELFMPFEQFPWFRTESIAAVMKVELAGPGHLYWPDLDVDLAIESIDHPERFPLVSQVPPNRAVKGPVGARTRRKPTRGRGA
ncbi:MAG: DUF2442 domain-containing protein [Planctomycetes bacterium]|nr:DUF2442 domain-containing protein [Planctomycetota bacterium]